MILARTSFVSRTRPVPGRAARADAPHGGSATELFQAFALLHGDLVQSGRQDGVFTFDRRTNIGSRVIATQREWGGGEMVTSCADLRIFQQMDPRSMSVDLSREGDEYVPEANLPGIDSESIELGGRPAAHRPRGERPVRDHRREVVHRRTAPRAIHAAAGTGARHRQRQRHRQLRPGHSVGGDALRAARPPEDPPGTARFLTLGTQPDPAPILRAL